MNAKQMEKVLKRSLVYSLAATQPFAVNLALASSLQDEVILENDRLKYGDHGELVSHIQLKLKRLGYYEGKVDGVYGLYTEHAVRKFQSSETITIDGIIDQQTYERLVQTEKREAFKQIENELKQIRYGEISENVTKVQQVLYFYGYYRGKIDGIYGPLTDEAIHKARSENLLPEETTTTEKVVELELDTSIKAAMKEEKQEKEEIIKLQVKANDQRIIQRAKTLIGSPYVWGGTSPSGFDCSGFVQFVYKQENILIPRTVNEIWNFATPVSSPSIGDLVFFETYQPGPSHLGIYLGDGNFIHAGASRGVEISNMHENEYWKSRYLGAKRIEH